MSKATILESMKKRVERLDAKIKPFADERVALIKAIAALDHESPSGVDQHGFD